MTSLGLMLMVGMPGTGALGQEGPEAQPPQSEEAARLEAARHLSHVNARLRVTDPDSQLLLRLERIRLLYFLSVAEEEYLELARGEIQALRPVGPDVLLDGFEAALTVVRGKHAFWPHHKLGHVKEGLGQLDELVGADPDNTELRYLRLLSSYYLPFFFGRGDTVEEDMRALARLLPADPGHMSLRAFKAVADFVSRHGELAVPQVEQIQAAVNRAERDGDPLVEGPLFVREVPRGEGS